jgi:hypothetical protein
LIWLRIGKVVGTCSAPLSKQAISLQYQIPFTSFSFGLNFKIWVYISLIF